jgi:lipase chaperone LimK
MRKGGSSAFSHRSFNRSSSRIRMPEKWLGPLCVICAAVLGLSTGVLYFRHAAPATATPTSVAADRETDWAAASVHAPAPDADTSLRIWPGDSSRANGLAVTDSHHLIVNDGLRDLMDYFLLEQTDEDRADQLKLYLRTRLRPPASEEAVQIVEHYVAYMKAHDDLLAAQNLNAQGLNASNVDINRIVTWRQQRDQLRERMLGDEVVQAWYQNDDSQLAQASDEYRQRAADQEGVAASAQQPRYPVPHWQNSREEQQHIQYLLGLLQKAVTSYSERSHEGQHWAERYSSYHNDAQKIIRDATLDASQRNAQLQALRVKLFPTQAERQRARELGP